MTSHLQCSFVLIYQKRNESTFLSCPSLSIAERDSSPSQSPSPGVCGSCPIPSPKERKLFSSSTRFLTQWPSWSPKCICHDPHAQKDTPSGKDVSFEPSTIEIGSGVWPMEVRKKKRARIEWWWFKKVQQHENSRMCRWEGLERSPWTDRYQSWHTHNTDLGYGHLNKVWWQSIHELSIYGCLKMPVSYLNLGDHHDSLHYRACTVHISIE